MSRGAGRAFNSEPLKTSHIREFFGSRPDGTLSFSILYGDVDHSPTRRLRMSFKTYFVFPDQAMINATPLNYPVPIGFSGIIEKESDEEYLSIT
jgi:hypothetical protein